MTLPEEQLVHLQVATKDIAKKDVSFTLSLKEPQLKSLPELLEIEQINHFQANGKITAIANNRFELTAQLNAQVVQISALSLAPLIRTVEEQFTAQFWPLSQQPSTKMQELDLEYEAEMVEFYQGNELDIGQIIYEHFVIALDQYPRAPDETFNWKNNQKHEEKNNPFSALNVLKDKKL